MSVLRKLHLEASRSTLDALAEAAEAHLRGLIGVDSTEPVEPDPDLAFDPRWER